MYMERKDSRVQTGASLSGMTQMQDYGEKSEAELVGGPEAF